MPWPPPRANNGDAALSVLSKLAVETKDDNLKETFYSSLYHTRRRPHALLSDVDGQFRVSLMNRCPSSSKGYDYYT